MSTLSSADHGVDHPPMCLKDGFGEAIVASDMPELCKLLSLDGCQKRFLQTHIGVDLTLHLVVGLALRGGDAEKFPLGT